MTNPQRDRIQKLFKDRPNQWIYLYPDILTLFISAYCRCIKELREPPYNMKIENDVKPVNGKRLSRYMYVTSEDLFR